MSEPGPAVRRHGGPLAGAAARGPGTWGDARAAAAALLDDARERL
ncbi:MAG TPA: hypothetical protein VMO88_06255 [Acidimicrobiales bacterium]|nr:hypothetical protein [Acidimicrobiales bacterium]